MDEAAIKRTPPNDASAEQAAIGAMINDNEMIPIVAEIITAADFYQPRYAKLFETIIKMNDERQPVDIITLSDKLAELGVPKEEADIKFLRELTLSVPTSARAKYYAEIVAKNRKIKALFIFGNYFK